MQRLRSENADCRCDCWSSSSWPWTCRSSSRSEHCHRNCANPFYCL